MAKNQRGLGRGLDALLPSSREADQEITDINIEMVYANKDQPRHKFSEESLQELAASISEHGILQPVLVRPVGTQFEIVAGERRWRAAKIAGLETIPAVVKDIDDIQVQEIALIENVQRDDLTVIEEGIAYKKLIDRYGYTQELLAQKVGKSRPYIANCLRMLTLPPEVKEMVEQGTISGGHARALLSISKPQDIIRVAREIAAGKLSVRETENKVKKKKMSPAKNKSIEIKELEEKLEGYFGSKTEINASGQGGKIEISYYNQDDLDRIVEILGLN